MVSALEMVNISEGPKVGQLPMTRASDDITAKAMRVLNVLNLANSLLRRRATLILFGIIHLKKARLIQIQIGLGLLTSLNWSPNVGRQSELLIKGT